MVSPVATTVDTPPKDAVVVVPVCTATVENQLVVPPAA
ncbi:hypothetical protein LEP1GSC112_0056, partial [Leptospira interrogans serovar Pomona str. UT364]